MILISKEERFYLEDKNQNKITYIEHTDKHGMLADWALFDHEGNPITDEETIRDIDEWLHEYLISQNK